MAERVTDNLNPTHEDVREWGYDEDLFFMQQDEDLLLYGLDYVPVLLELARDPACPKGYYALSILGQFSREAALYGRPEVLEELGRTLDALPPADASPPPVEEWRDGVGRLRAYQRHPFPVEKLAARLMAQDLLLGIGRVGQVTDDGVTEGADGRPEAWRFLLVTSIRETLSINARTGEYTYGGA